MNKKYNIKNIVAIIFILMLFLNLIKSDSYNGILKLSEYLRQDEKSNGTIGYLTIDAIETEFSSTLWNQQALIDLNGLIAKKLNIQGFYSDMGMYITDDNYIVSAEAYATTDYEYEQITAFNAFLKEHGINLMYVNKPTKYVDDSLFCKEFGIETYSNRNADRFIQRIEAAGIPTLDLRDNINEEGLNISDLFYRTDHHWTTDAGLWAAEIIAEGLNRNCGYNIDTSIYDEDKYVVREWKECWLGEQGKKLGKTYVGLDDYREIKPKFETSYWFRIKNGLKEATFDDFIDESVYNTEIDVYQSPSWHYSYMRTDCINNNVEYGKLLILGDSFESVTEPFLSLGVHEVDTLVLRDCHNEFDLKKYILDGEYDTVIVCYVQFMIGAHDDLTSANYRMFSFE